MKRNRPSGDLPLWRLKPENIARLRENYPKGLRVRLSFTTDPFTDLKEGDLGTVDYVDDEGTIHVIWDSGEHFGVRFAKDCCVPLNT